MIRNANVYRCITPFNPDDYTIECAGLAHRSINHRIRTVPACKVDANNIVASQQFAGRIVISEHSINLVDGSFQFLITITGGNGHHTVSDFGCGSMVNRNSRNHGTGSEAPKMDASCLTQQISQSLKVLA